MIKLLSLLFEGMNPDQANHIFARHGISAASSLSKKDLKMAWMKLVKTHHPDTGGKDIDMRYINAAYDVLKNIAQEKKTNYTHQSNKDTWDFKKKKSKKREYDDNWKYDEYPFRKDPKVPLWAWAGWSGGYPPNGTYTDVPNNMNYVKRKAWEMSGKPSSIKQNEYRFWDWDGSQFRQAISVYAKDDADILFRISELVMAWGSTHTIGSVFFQKVIDPRNLFLINIRGKRIDPMKEFEHDSFNANPSHDQDFVEYLRKNIG